MSIDMRLFWVVWLKRVMEGSPLRGKFCEIFSTNVVWVMEGKVYLHKRTYNEHVQDNRHGKGSN